MKTLHEDLEKKRRFEKSHVHEEDDENKSLNITGR